MGIPGGCRDACGCRWPGGPMLCVPMFIIPGLPPIIIGPLPLITAPLLVMELVPGSGEVPRRMSRLPSPFPRPPNNNKPWDILSHKCTTVILKRYCSCSFSLWPCFKWIKWKRWRVDMSKNFLSVIWMEGRESEFKVIMTFFQGVCLCYLVVVAGAALPH